MAEQAGPMLRRFKRDVEHSSRRSGGLIQFGVELPPLSRPEPLVEPDDMVRIDFPCHPGEPVKVEEGWGQEVSCLICGVRYPVELVRALRSSEPDERGLS